jgi:preprotein translocase subunit SecG
MANVLIVAYLLIVLALIGVILIQRSEGGGLGMSSNSGGLVTVRGTANLLTRTTAILATLFFATAIGLTILAELDRGTDSILQQAADSIGTGVDTGPINVLDAFNRLGASSDLPVPTSTTTPTTTTLADPGLSGPADPAATTTTLTDPGLALPADAVTAPTTTTAPAN